MIMHHMDRNSGGDSGKAAAVLIIVVRPASAAAPSVWTGRKLGTAVPSFLFQPVQIAGRYGPSSSVVWYKQAVLLSL